METLIWLSGISVVALIIAILLNQRQEERNLPSDDVVFEPIDAEIEDEPTPSEGLSPAPAPADVEPPSDEEDDDEPYPYDQVPYPYSGRESEKESHDEPDADSGNIDTSEPGSESDDESTQPVG